MELLLWTFYFQVVLTETLRGDFGGWVRAGKLTLGSRLDRSWQLAFADSG